MAADPGPVRRVEPAGNSGGTYDARLSSASAERLVLELNAGAIVAAAASLPSSRACGYGGAGAAGRHAEIAGRQGAHPDYVFVPDRARGRSRTRMLLRSTKKGRLTMSEKRTEERARAGGEANLATLAGRLREQVASVPAHLRDEAMAAADSVHAHAISAEPDASKMTPHLRRLETYAELAPTVNAILQALSNVGL